MGARGDRWDTKPGQSVQLLLGDARPGASRNGARPKSTPVVARSEMACQQLTGPGTRQAILWVELKKALTANAMTEAQGLVPSRDLYERVLDRNGRSSPSAANSDKTLATPVTGISWDQVDTHPTRRRFE